MPTAFKEQLYSHAFVLIGTRIGLKMLSVMQNAVRGMLVEVTIQLVQKVLDAVTKYCLLESEVDEMIRLLLLLNVKVSQRSFFERLSLPPLRGTDGAGEVPSIELQSSLIFAALFEPVTKALRIKLLRLS